MVVKNQEECSVAGKHLKVKKIYRETLMSGYVVDYDHCFHCDSTLIKMKGYWEKPKKRTSFRVFQNGEYGTRVFTRPNMMEILKTLY